MTRHTYWKIAKESVAEFWEDSPFQLAAALSFYTLLSLSPLVLIVVAAAGLVWSEASVRAQLLNQIRELVGQAGAETVRTVLEGTTVSGRNIGSMVAGIVTLLVGATTVFAQLQSALNQIWDVKTPVKTVARRGLFWDLIRTRLLSLALIFVVGFLLLVSLVVSAGLAALQDYLVMGLPGGGTLWQTANFLVSLLVISVLIAMVYRLLPDGRSAVCHCRPGWRVLLCGLRPRRLSLCRGDQQEGRQRLRPEIPGRSWRRGCHPGHGGGHLLHLQECRYARSQHQGLFGVG